MKIEALGELKNRNPKVLADIKKANILISGSSIPTIRNVIQQIEPTNPSQTSVKFKAFTTNNIQKDEKRKSIK